MKLEHVAVNVKDPIAMAKWYAQNLGMEIVRSSKVEPFTHFLRDVSGMIMIEIYRNPPDMVPDYANMNPLTLHIAFVSDDPDKDKKNLMDAGAMFVSEQKLEDGSHLVMLRDPWGLSIQLCKRGTPMLL